MSVFTESDPTSPKSNKVILDVVNGQDEHQDTGVGGDTNVTIPMDDRHLPLAMPLQHPYVRRFFASIFAAPAKVA